MNTDKFLTNDQTKKLLEITSKIYRQNEEELLPKTAGYWQVTLTFRIGSPQKPNWFRRVMNRWLIGWVWIDEKK